MWNVALHGNIVKANFNLILKKKEMVSSSVLTLFSLTLCLSGGNIIRGCLKTPVRLLLAGVWRQKRSDLFIISASVNIITAPQGCQPF